jgi:4-hydroxy-tetrahydrodipicolinate synthase
MRGIFPIVQTPFHADGSLDPATLAKETTFLLQCGVQGMAWPQLASEFWSLSVDERQHGAEALLKAGKGGKAKLVIGVQSDDAATSVRLAKHAAANGADALISLPPAGIGLVDFFTKIAAAAPGLPLFLQAVGKLSVEEVIELSRAVPAVQYVKDEAGVTLPRISEFQSKAQRLNIFTGAHGRTLIDELLRGASGSMPAAGPADLYAKAFVLFEKGRHKEAAPPSSSPNSNSTASKASNTCSYSAASLPITSSAPRATPTLALSPPKRSSTKPANAL